MAKYTVAAGQNIYDVAIITCGTVAAVPDILALNLGVDINTALRPGQSLTVPNNYTGTAASRRILGYFATKPIKPATLGQILYRITEDGQDRITEAGQRRIIE